MDHLVFDTSAILNFGQRDHLEEVLVKLGTIYKIVTTEDVTKEISDPNHRAFYDQMLQKHFKRLPSAKTRFSVATMSRLSSMIGSGEISVIILAAELQGIAVLDDLAARAEADKLGLKMMGTLGLMKEAMQHGWLTDDQCIDKVQVLHANKFRIRKPHANETFTEYFSAMK